MLAKKNRLRLDKDFEMVFKYGRNTSNIFFNLKINKNDLQWVRFGIVVSNKISKKANQRNLIKRRIRAILRECLPRMKTGYDIVILTKKEIFGVKYKDLQSAVQNTLRRVGIL